MTESAQPESDPSTSPTPADTPQPAPLDRSRIQLAIDALAQLIALVVVRSIPGLTMIPAASSLLASTIRSSFSPVLELEDDELRPLVYAFAQELGAIVRAREPADWTDPATAAAAARLLAALEGRA